MPTPPLTLRLDQLRDPVHVRSRALGEDLWIAPDEYAGETLEGVVYSVSECLILLELAPGRDELVAIHRAKARLDADLVRDTDQSSVRQAYHAALARYRELERACDQGGSPETEAELLALAQTLTALTGRLEAP